MKEEEEEYARRRPVKTLEGSLERRGDRRSKCAHALSCVYSCTRGAVELCVRVTYVCGLFFFRVPLLAALHSVGTTLRTRASANIWS